MKTCPVCGEQVPDNETTCPGCGTDLASMQAEGSPLQPEPNSQQPSSQAPPAAVQPPASTETQPPPPIGSADAEPATSSKTAVYPGPGGPQPAASATLILKQGGVLTNVRYPLGERVVLGRFDPELGPPDIDLGTVEGGQYVSRRHAEIYRDADGKWYIKDLGSTNGTFIYDPQTNSWKRIAPNHPVELTDNIELAIAAVRFVFKTS